MLEMTNARMVTHIAIIQLFDSAASAFDQFAFRLLGRAMQFLLTVGGDHDDCSDGRPAGPACTGDHDIADNATCQRDLSGKW